MIGYSLHSPALALNDFFLFLQIKNKFGDQRFSTPEEAIDVIKSHVLVPRNSCRFYISTMNCLIVSTTIFAISKISKPCEWRFGHDQHPEALIVETQAVEAFDIILDSVSIKPRDDLEFAIKDLSNILFSNLLRVMNHFETY